MIRVFVADHHAVVREGVCRLLADAPDLVVAGETGDGRDLLERAKEEAWDVLVLDFSSDEMGGIEVLRKLRKLRPTLSIVALSMYPESQYTVPVLKTGALAYLSKGRSSAELLDAVLAAAQGRTYVTGEAAKAIFVEASPAWLGPTSPPGTTAGASNLPRVAKRIFGREEDLQRVADALAGIEPVVTVIGPPGTGKTLLVHHYAASHGADFPGGVLWCDVTEASTLDGVCRVVARALELDLADGAPAAQIARALAARGPALVLLDNVEQAVGAAAPLLSAWTTQAPAARFLTTSREALKIAGERLVRLGPLELPAAGADRTALAANPAAALFVERARAVAPGFALTDANAAEVGALLRLLDGLPLAIELAAARVPVLPLAGIVARLSQGFDLLRDGRRDAHERQATLRGAFDWSWELLAPYERAVLAQSSVFSGGFSLDAAEAVFDFGRGPGAPLVIDVVQALFDKSLLRVVRQQPSAAPVFGMLQSVAAYAAERLRDPSAIAGTDGTPASGPEAARRAEERHAAHFATYGSDAAIDALTALGGEARQLALFEQAANVAVALDRAIAAQRGEQAVRCCLALGEILGRRGPFSAMSAQLTATLALPGIPPRLRALLLLVDARCALWAGDRPRAESSAAAALALARELEDPRIEAAALVESARWRTLGDDVASAVPLAEAGVLLARGARDVRTELVGLRTLAVAAQALGRTEEAALHNEALLELAQRVGNIEAKGYALHNLGLASLVSRQFADGADRFAKAAELASRLHNRPMEGFACAGLALCRARAGDLAGATVAAEAAVALVRGAGPRTEGFPTYVHAEVLLLTGDVAGARQTALRAESLLREAGDAVELGLALTRRAHVEAVAGDLAAAQAALAEAEALAARVRCQPESELGMELGRVRPIVHPETRSGR